MRDLILSMMRFSWSMSLLGLKTAADLLSPRRRAAEDLDAVSRAAREELGDGVLGSVFETADKIQSRVVDGVFDAMKRPARPQDGGLDSGRFVALGGSLAAGMGDFRLSARSQTWSFPAQMARQMGVAFEQPLFQSPGLGHAPGLRPLPVIVPDLGQTTVRARLPESEGELDNLSVPGLALADVHTARPAAPLVRRDDDRQTLVNFVYGLPGIARSRGPGPTPVECLRRARPSLVVLELGYEECTAAATCGTAMPDPERFQADFERLLDAVDGASVVALTVPDPVSTAWFSDLATAATILKTEAAFLRPQFGLRDDDLLTLPGLYEIGYQLMGRRTGPLEAGAAVDARRAAEISDGVRKLNAAIRLAAAAKNVTVVDLHRLFDQVARHGLNVGSKRLTGSYLGGFYRLNGLVPGATGQAVIANEILARLNDRFGSHFVPVDTAAVAADDPTTLSELAPGPRSTREFLEPRGELTFAPLAPDLRETPIQTTYPGLEPGKDDCVPFVGVPAGGYEMPDPPRPLKLPEGLEQTLDLNPEESYLGDALRAVDCPGEKPFLPGFPPFGACADVSFGGPMLTTSYLRGQVHIRFSPPDENDVSTFEVRHPQGLRGGDGDLVAPWLFRMPLQGTRIEDVPGLPSRGKVDLRTGAVTDLHYNIRNTNTGLATLVKVNPGHPLPHLAVLYPGSPGGGSSWARFDPRPDGKLDFTFTGNLFVPLGDRVREGRPLRFALPFTTPDLDAASFVARGTSLHPQLHLTTRATPPTDPGPAPDIPRNSLLEMSPFVHNTSFGDAFDLDIPELGGEATGRSHLMGRVRLQTGVETEGRLPVLVQVLPPGGLLSDAPRMPPFLPPGTSRGMIGFDAVLRFPKVSYHQSGLACADDPYNLAIGNVDLRSGRFLGPLLLRGFVIQALFGRLLAVEPCTPGSSFHYQGPASLECAPEGDLVLRFDGTVFLPYPTGFRFPSPGPTGKPPFTVVGPSRLDPFRRIRALREPTTFQGTLSGSGESLVSSTGQRFSYSYTVAAGEVAFEYTNHAQGGTFRLTSLSWLGCAGYRGGRPDALTFGGFGTWSQDSEVHQVSVHVSTAPGASYVGILVDGGLTSNADTKPADLAETLP